MGTTTLDLPDVLSIKEGSGNKGIEVVDDEKGIVQAFVSVTGVKDRVNDIIHPGAYEKTLNTRTPKGLIGHDWKQLVSKAIEVKELMPGDPGLPDMLSDGTPWPADAGALYVKAQYNLNTQRGRDAYEDAKFFGPDQEWSIGYSVPKTKEAAYKDGKGTRHIKELDLFEFSQVLWGAMPHARTTSVKDMEDVELEVKDDEVKGIKHPITLDDGSYPIQNAEDLRKAINLRNNGKAGKEKIYAHIKRCASLLGRTDMLPDDMKVDANENETKDQKTNGEAVPVLHQETVEQMDVKELLEAWHTIGRFLHERKAISDDVAAVVFVTEAKALDTARSVVKAFVDIFTDDSEAGEKAFELASVYDFALTHKNDSMIEQAQDAWGNFLGGQQRKGVDVAGMAAALLELAPVTDDADPDLEDAHKDDQDDDKETKSDDQPAPVVMSHADFMASLGLAN